MHAPTRHVPESVHGYGQPQYLKPVPSSYQKTVVIEKLETTYIPFLNGDDQISAHGNAVVWIPEEGSDDYIESSDSNRALTILESEMHAMNIKEYKNQQYQKHQDGQDNSKDVEEEKEKEREEKEKEREEKKRALKMQISAFRHYLSSSRTLRQKWNKKFNSYVDKGIIVAAGRAGAIYNAFVTLYSLRKGTGCTLPVVVAYYGEKEFKPSTREFFKKWFWNIQFLDLEKLDYPSDHHVRCRMVFLGMEEGINSYCSETVPRVDSRTC